MLAVKLTSDTIGLIGQRELSLMKPTATLINISRGKNDAFVLDFYLVSSIKITYQSPPQAKSWTRML